MKGPVYFGAAVVQRQLQSAEGTDFALWIGADHRPGLIGRWTVI
jgi:hypothetical protein